MNITVDMMKKINAGIASKKYLTVKDIAAGCSLDAGALEAAADEDMDKQITSMTMFFDILSAYLAEIDNRMKMMNECYKAIQKLQMDNDMIQVTDETPDPAIIWRG